MCALTRFAWTQPGITTVDLWVEPGHAASLAVARRAGYAEVAWVGGSHLIGGRRRDMVRLSQARPALGDRRSDHT